MTEFFLRTALSHNQSIVQRWFLIAVSFIQKTINWKTKIGFAIDRESLFQGGTVYYNFVLQVYVTQKVNRIRVVINRPADSAVAGDVTEMIGYGFYMNKVLTLSMDLLLTRYST